MTFLFKTPNRLSQTSISSIHRDFLSDTHVMQTYNKNHDHLTINTKIVNDDEIFELLWSCIITVFCSYNVQCNNFKKIYILAQFFCLMIVLLAMSTVSAILVLMMYHIGESHTCSPPKWLLRTAAVIARPLCMSNRFHKV